MLSVLIPFETSYLWDSEFSALFAILIKVNMEREMTVPILGKKIWVSEIKLKLPLTLKLLFLNLIFTFSLRLKLLYLEFRIC
jgi:hypothetical protein